MSKSVFGLLKSAEVVSFHTDGTVDWESTLHTIQAKVETELAESAERDYVIEEKLNAIFDQLPSGGSVPRPLAVSMVVGEIIPDNKAIAAKTEWNGYVNDYLDRSNKFVGKRGRNGGLFKA